MLTTLALTLSLLCGAAPAPTAPAAPPALATMAKERSAALVTVKFILKSEEGENEAECPGVMVEESGVVLASNRNMGGFAPFGPNLNPTNVKVLIGEDTQGVEASLIARDTELGLAWVKVKEPKGPYARVDFSKGTSATIGEPLYAVSLLSKFFDRAPAVTEGTVAAVTTKPRALLVASLSLAGTEFGVPVFGAGGEPVGVMTLILPDQEELAGTPGGPQEIFRNVPGGKVILPSAAVLAATKRAQESPTEMPAETTGEPATKVEPAPGSPGAPATAPASPK
jgi:S1-C subfamily serine protease